MSNGKAHLNDTKYAKLRACTHAVKLFFVLSKLLLKTAMQNALHLTLSTQKNALD